VNVHCSIFLAIFLLTFFCSWHPLFFFLTTILLTFFFIPGTTLYLFGNQFFLFQSVPIPHGKSGRGSDITITCSGRWMARAAITR